MLNLTSQKRWAGLFIIISSLCACLLLYYVEQGFAANYVVKTATKILLFIGIPSYYHRRLHEEAPAAQSGPVSFESLKLGALLGMGAFVVILLTYLALHNYLDLPAIAQELEDKSRITATNFILVGLYIAFGNSFLEEYFFRGFVFAKLLDLGRTPFAYLYSALLFGLYHVAIFKTWFSPPLMLIALVGLVAAGTILNLLNTKSRHFFNSWLAHILADMAIILVGLRMFQLISSR